MIFGLGIHYLNGWVMAAADGAKKERVEWPPHPDRIFMALAAAWFETGQDENEKGALEWLEILPVPGLVASGAEIRHELKNNNPVTSHVPVNDIALAQRVPNTQELNKLKKAGLSLIPEYRFRQPRKFPVAIPHVPIVHLVWRENLPETYRTPLSNLCGKVISIGYSASLVQMWLTEHPPVPNIIPVEGIAKYRLRVFGPGKLKYLKNRCNREKCIRYRDLSAMINSHQKRKKTIEQTRKAASKGLKGSAKKEAEAPFRQEIDAIETTLTACRAELENFKGQVPNSLRPEPSLWQGYDHPPTDSASIPSGNLFDERFIVLDISGKSLNLPSTLKLTGAIRGAILSACPEPIPEWISGHQSNGSRSNDPHLAVFPLPFVGNHHADGRIMGIALALPRSLDKKEAGKFLESWLWDKYGQPRQIKLFDGKWLECKMEIDTRETPPWNLRRSTWVRSSTLWASVTPVVLDRHFDGRNKWEKAAEVVKDSCERVGFSRPGKVLLHPVSLVEGTPHSRDFPPIKRKSDNGRMHHCHAIIQFVEPVTGPMLIGAGRFRGYGLCRPMEQGRENNA